MTSLLIFVVPVELVCQQINRLGCNTQRRQRFVVWAFAALFLKKLQNCWSNHLPFLSFNYSFLVLYFLFFPLPQSQDILFSAQQPWMCSVCSGLLYNRSSDFISCNKYFRILFGVTDEFFTESVFNWTLVISSGAAEGSWTAPGMSCQER